MSLKFHLKYRVTTIALALLSVLVIAPALGQNKYKMGTEDALKLLKSIEEVELFYQQTSMEFQQLGKELEKESDARKAIAKLANACCVKILRLSKTDDDRVKGYKLKLTGLKILIDDGNPDGVVQTQSLIKDLRKKKGLEKSAEAAEYLLFMARIKMVDPEKMTSKGFDAFMQETGKQLKYESLVDNYPEIVTTVMRTTQRIAKTQNTPQLIDKAGETLTTLLKSGSINEETRNKLLFAIKGYCCRGVGKPMDLYGKTIDDRDFDWSAYRGKIVLVNFTASWCGPCKAELPGMFDAWRKYRDQGFEIVSVGVFDSNDKLKEMISSKNIPWTFLSEASTKKADQESLASRYAIRTIPVMLLIDRDGKIISDEVRGTSLEERLSEIFSQ